MVIATWGHAKARTYQNIARAQGTFDEALGINFGIWWTNTSQMMYNMRVKLKQVQSVDTQHV